MQAVTHYNRTFSLTSLEVFFAESADSAVKRVVVKDLDIFAKKERNKEQTTESYGKLGWFF